MKETNNKLRVIEHSSYARTIKDLFDHKHFRETGEKKYVPFEGKEDLTVPKDLIEGTYKVFVNGEPYEYEMVKSETKYYDYEVFVECKTGDEIRVEYDHYVEKSEWSIEFEKFLESIGGLVNGYYTDRDPIKSRGYCEVGDGWLPIIKDLIEKMIEAGWDKQICQIKEKFGGLRFYINSGSDEMYKLISEAENKSYETCEVCGKPGKQTTGGWISTLCEEHMK